MDSPECSEILTVKFEWTLRGLKNLFDSTKGNKKSKATKSAPFGSGRWQVLFYASAGQQKEGSEGGYISLFLSCKPTAEEKEAALAHSGESGRWVREGVYTFRLELRNLTKSVLYNSKEAQNHTFTSKTENWGWPQFARRDSVYYQSTPAKIQDAFIIICTIESSPSAPRLCTTPRQHIPKTLLDTVGNLLDDPLYSDVEFIIEKGSHGHSNIRSIYACKKMLCRVEYFQTMFTSGFVEDAKGTTDIQITPKSFPRNLNNSATRATSVMEKFEDSDDEDDEIFDSSSPDDTLIDLGGGVRESFLDDTTGSDNLAGRSDAPESIATFVDIPMHETSVQRVVSQDPISSPKTRIQVRDVAYTTYRAMLYYIYTDNVVFAPLSSSFQSSSPELSDTGEQSPSPPSEESPGGGAMMLGNSLSRAEWIRNWERTNPGRPTPCSAKSIYRLADRLDLTDLKERATDHIIKSLTVDNIANEIFSTFAACHEDIRKTEIEFFLNHWNEIRASDVMKNIWIQIRNGKHPGFEQVWPLIAQNLEFQPAR